MKRTSKIILIMKKNQSANFLNTVNEIMDTARKKDIIHLYTEDQSYNGRSVIINGQELINFGSCSYLGLEIDSRLKAASIEAIQNFGLQFSSSRSYVSTTLYKEWEQLLQEMFGHPLVITPTTSLGHHAVIPVAVEAGDAIILDQQVHASVQDAVSKMLGKGQTIEVVRHNDMEALESKIQSFLKTHDNIWYMADGIYSMYGDYAPLDDLKRLLDTYPNFRLYIDDAHGMSITGKHGKGYVLDNIGTLKNTIVALSFAKAYGCGGAAFVFPDAEMAQKVRNCGGPMIFSGPLQIPTIAGGIASAKIHLSDEIYQLQDELKSKVALCYDLLVQNNIPVMSNRETPVFYVGLGLTRVGYNMVGRLMKEGCYTNLGIYPAVPETCTGIRFTITNHLTTADIHHLVEAFVKHFPLALAEEGRTIHDIQRAFRKVKTNTLKLPVPSKASEAPTYRVEHYDNIELISEDVWNGMFKGTASFDWGFLKMLQNVFAGNLKAQDNWDFHYYITYDASNTPVLATFFTSSLVKDDMFASAQVSQAVEIDRMINPKYLTTKSLVMGCMLTEGNHLFVDRKNPEWKGAMMAFIDKLWTEQDRLKAEAIYLRDFPLEDIQMTDFVAEQGFVKVGIPSTHVIDDIKWENVSEYMASLSSKKRSLIKRKVVKYSECYNVEVIKSPSIQELKKWYDLYLSVKSGSYELNSFVLPFKLFEEFSKYPKAELIQISIKPEHSNSGLEEVGAVTLNYMTASNDYCGLIVGLDYAYVRSKALYKNMILENVVRAGALGANKLYLGMTASESKRDFGAKSKSQVAFFQMKDDYNLKVLSNIAQNASYKRQK